MSAFWNNFLGSSLAAGMTFGWVVWGAPRVFAADDCCKSNQGFVEATVKLADGVSIGVAPQTWLEGLVSVTMTSENMTRSCSLPHTFNIRVTADKLGRPIELVRARQLDRGSRYQWQHHLYFRIGNSGGRHESNYVYSLPYRKGEKHRIAQGYNGKLSHNAANNCVYAIDFDMPEGTTVCAAREGTVIAYKNDSNVGGADKRFEDCGNYVAIKHSDGSYAIYNHLRYNGVLVRLGQSVSKGMSLGLSGSTGWASGPHLHFAVFVPVDGLHSETYPTKFATEQGILSELQEGFSY